MSFAGNSSGDIKGWVAQLFFAVVHCLVPKKIPTNAYLDVLRTFIIGIFPGGSQCGVHDK